MRIPRRLPRRLSRRNLIIIAVLVGLSLYQGVTDGSITWHKTALDRVSAYINRDSASWKQATDQINDSFPDGAPAEFDLQGRVVRVFDGDTVSVLDGDKQQHKVRLYAIDSPEWDQAYGKAAKRELTRLVDGETVGIDIRDTDPYGRSVGYLWLGQTNINREMVAAGLAWWYRYHGPGEHALREAEAEARAQRTGLWADEDPMAPWDWRRARR
ncbi:MAG: thermonuclease family protein [Pseudomonadota bacterium]